VDPERCAIDGFFRKNHLKCTVFCEQRGGP
jgi:hypothetical protein